PDASGQELELASREALGEQLAMSTFAAKLDQWMLHACLGVIADLYKRGQEYPVIVPLTARSLSNKRLAETVRAELKSFALPGEILTLDFRLTDVTADLENGLSQL